MEVRHVEEGCCLVIARQARENIGSYARDNMHLSKAGMTEGIGDSEMSQEAGDDDDFHHWAFDQAD
jgi:hypothetical protein